MEENPMALKITVIGAGPGGYIAAIRAAQLGAHVTIIEKESVGGCCLNRGCIPSKILKTTAEMLEKFHKAEEFGIKSNASATPDMKAIMERKNRIIKAQTEGIMGLLKQHRITVLKGEGCIKEPGLALVKQENDKRQLVEWDRLILALGSSPIEIPSFPFDGRKIISSKEVLNLREVPNSLLIVGGGVIGCEFACIMNALGSNITIVEAQNRLLPIDTLDESCSKVLQREMKKRKIAVHVNKTIEKIENNKMTLTASVTPSEAAGELAGKESNPIMIDVDKMLVCIGQKPDTAHAGLEKLELKQDQKGWIIADERLQTSEPHVFAIGDLLGPSKIMLAHVASKEGMVAAENAMGMDSVMDYTAVPGAIFTIPEIAHVGITEKQAIEKGLDIDVETTLFRTLGKAQVMGEIAGQAKIISHKDNGKILGIHLIGPHATDLIAEGTLAIQTGAQVQDIAKTIHAHPTLSEIMGETSYKILGRPLHG